MNSDADKIKALELAVRIFDIANGMPVKDDGEPDLEKLFAVAKSVEAFFKPGR